jgi:hypothetical protein
MYISKTIAYILRIEVKMGTIDLIKPPKKVLGGPVNVVAARIVREIVGQGTSRKFVLEKIHFVQEQDDARSHKPAAIDNRVKKY